MFITIWKLIVISNPPLKIITIWNIDNIGRLSLYTYSNSLFTRWAKQLRIHTIRHFAASQRLAFLSSPGAPGPAQRSPNSARFGVLRPNLREESVAETSLFRHDQNQQKPWLQRQVNHDKLWQNGSKFWFFEVFWTRMGIRHELSHE